jgi:hypothetical protein
MASGDAPRGAQSERTPPQRLCVVPPTHSPMCAPTGKNISLLFAGARQFNNANKVYIGNLNPRATERDIEDEFGRYGKLVNVWVARKPPGRRAAVVRPPRHT